ncbi:unknown [Roseburia sp. CAG:182]|nr:unknown [Roseburia sp. CAG:182]
MDLERRKVIENMIEILAKKGLLTLEEKNKIRFIVNTGK